MAWRENDSYMMYIATKRCAKHVYNYVRSTMLFSERMGPKNVLVWRRYMFGWGTWKTKPNSV